jgi:ribosome-binding ATPase YchF (GTP1/OBG family)
MSKMNHIALLGQPNSGKSTVFNQLTGSHQHVGNWPGKTVEKKNYYEEEQFSAYEPVSSVTVEQENYPVMIVSEDLIRERAY